MTRPQAQFNRFFVSTDFSVSYRRAKQLQWQSQATSGYSLLAILKGQLTYTADNNSLDLDAPQFVLFEPNVSINANASHAEFLFLTLSASFVMQHATAMRLIPPNSTITLKPAHFSGDQKLDPLFAEFVAELTDD